MITDKLKTILTASGCTLVIYEQSELANLYTDKSNQFDIVGIIIQPDDITLEVRANAIQEHFNPLIIQVVQQVKLEDKAEENEAKLQALLNICKVIIIHVIAAAEFKTILPVTVTKIKEKVYDANLIGWSIPLNLYWLQNETREPCL